jgi:hypothetical protein
MDAQPRKHWTDLVRTIPRQRALLLLASVAAALFLGFLAFNPSQAQSVVHDYGYFLILFTFAWFAYSMVRGRRESRNQPSAARPDVPGSFSIFGFPLSWGVIAVTGSSLLCVIAEKPQEKILYDEHVIEATAMYMHFNRNVSTVVRGYDVNGVFLSLTHYLDKRPYFFALLLSLLHDVTGYRLANAYWLNAGLTVLVLSLLLVIGRRLAGALGGILAVLLFGTLPLLGQNASGAGIEVLNLVMILMSLLLGIRAAECPSENRLESFVLAIVLLTQVRYESALYVVAAALVLVVIWRREQKVTLPWAAVAAPLMLVPIPLLQLVLSANRVMWDLPANLESRFGIVHLKSNLQHAGNFFSSVSREHPNSPLLAILGFAGAIGCAWLVCRRPASVLSSPTHWVLAAFSLVILANFGLLMFYFWGALDDPMVSRLALPLYLLLTCAAVAWLGVLDRTRPVLRWGIVATLVALPITYGRVTPLHLYTSQNLVAAELRWENFWISTRGPGSRLVITNKSSLPWMLRREPALLISNVRSQASQLRFHLQEGTFSEVLVMQRLRPTTPLGNFALDPQDRLPDEFHLEPLIEKRFGTSLDRISRLTEITSGGMPP